MSILLCWTVTLVPCMEMEKAIIGYGEYRLRPQYSFLAISEEKWFKMTQDQRLRWIQKFNVCAVRPCTGEGPSTSTLLDSRSTMLCSSTAASDLSINFQEDSSKEKDPLNSFHEEDPSFPESDITVGHFSIVDGQSLSVSVEEGIANTHLPKPTAEVIWKKAAMHACRGGESNCSCTWVWSERKNNGEIQVRCDPSFGYCCKEWHSGTAQMWWQMSTV